MTEPTAPDDDTKARLVKLLDAVEATPEAALASYSSARDAIPPLRRHPNTKRRSRGTFRRSVGLGCWTDGAVWHWPPSPSPSCAGGAARYRISLIAEHTLPMLLAHLVGDDREPRRSVSVFAASGFS
jgi:hypothetical protein